MFWTSKSKNLGYKTFKYSVSINSRQIPFKQLTGIDANWEVGFMSLYADSNKFASYVRYVNTNTPNGPYCKTEESYINLIFDTNGPLMSFNN